MCRKRFAGILLTILTLLLSACGPDNSTPTLSTNQPTFNAASAVATTLSSTANTTVITTLNQAANNFSKLQSLHLHLEIRQGKVEINGAGIKYVDGDLSQLDKYQAQVRVSTIFGDFSLPVIGIGGQQYMKNEFGSWSVSNEQQTVNLAVLLDSQSGLGPTLLKMQKVQVLPQENLSGSASPAHHLQGELTGADIKALTFGKLGNLPVTLEVWVSQSNEPQIAQVYLKEIGSGPDLAFWAYSFNNYNATVQIQKPKV